MNELFEQSIRSIQNFYEDKDYSLGWRFLACSKRTLENEPLIALITSNTGGKEIPENHPWGSCEKGSAYLYEEWDNNPPGKHNLQIQIKLMFEKIIDTLQVAKTTNELIEESLTGNFVPFRSPRLKDLKYKGEALDFASVLWSNILRHVKPKLFIILGLEAHKRLRPIIEDVYGYPMTGTCKYRTGWGNYTADLDKFGDKSQLTMLRLPHLSKFKLFTSPQCTDYLNIILSEACKGLQ